VIASALIPRFKLQWLPDTEQFDVEEWLKAEFENEDNRNSDSQNENEEENKDKVDDFFGDIVAARNATTLLLYILPPTHTHIHFYFCYVNYIIVR